MIALFAMAINKKLSDSEDPNKTAMEIGKVFANITRSNLSNE